MKVKLKPVITAAAVVLVLGSAGATAGVSLATSYEQTLTSAERELTMQIDSYSMQINEILDSFRNQMQLAAQNTSAYDENLPMDERKAIMAEMATQSDLLDFSISNVNGITYSDTDIHEREYFIEAMKGVTYISSPVIRKTNNSTVIMAAARLPDASGAIYSGISYDTFVEKIAETDFENSFSFIIDAKGQVVSYPDAAVVSKIMTLPDLAKENADEFEGIASLSSKMTAGESGETTVLYKGEEYNTVFKPLGNTEGWSIAFGVSKAEQMGTFNSLLTTILIILGILSLVGLAGGLGLAKILGTPAKLVSDRLSLLVKGDLKTEFPKYHSLTIEYHTLFITTYEMIKMLQAYIADIENVLSSLSNKDLTVHTHVEYKGDFDAIHMALRSIKNNLINVVGTIGDVADNLTSGSMQLANASQNLAETSSEQSANIDSLTQGVTNVTDSVKHTTEVTAEAVSLVDSSVKSANDGKNKMTMMLNSMDEIRTASEEINKIIKTIDDIAFQTNILALNAAVEAARAGEAGKGFSVVAEEVRNLASKSAEAAKETTALIANSITAVAGGAKIANDTAQSLDLIVNHIEDVNRLIGTIAQATKVQSSELSVISSNVESIGNAMHTNSATAEEAAATTKQFENTAEELTSMIHEFSTEK
ncbi:MAG: methyl-accepting chemotaxis protein [Ruminococcus sp.]|jgi:methyl-accepting chemotaxis protein|nr:methyl-accepting chemotaxis protein [Ruminococcus sp.]